MRHDEAREVKGRVSLCGDKAMLLPFQGDLLPDALQIHLMLPEWKLAPEGLFLPTKGVLGHKGLRSDGPL